jgi:protein TonB
MTVMVDTTVQPERAEIATATVPPTIDPCVTSAIRSARLSASGDTGLPCREEVVGEGAATGDEAIVGDEVDIGYELDLGDEDDQSDPALSAAVGEVAREVGRRPAGWRSLMAAVAASLACHGVVAAAGILVVLGVRAAATGERAGAGGPVESSLLGPESAAAASSAFVQPLPAPPPSYGPRSPSPTDIESGGPETVIPSPLAPLPATTVDNGEDAAEPALSLATSRTTGAFPAFPKRSLGLAAPDPAPGTAPAGGAGNDPAAPQAAAEPAAAAPADTGVRVASGRPRAGFDNRGLPIPEYPPESKRRREHGLVEIEVEVLPDGRVGETRVLADAGYPRLAEAALAAVRRGEFEPATHAGQRVVGRLIVPFRFVLK